MSRERMKLLPWLRCQINSGKFSGLRWCNKSKTEFRIDWKHGSRQEYRPDHDACVFKAWAVYTGRYKKGIHKPLPKRWKANFRCALNSLSEISQVHSRGERRGPGAFRVFRIRTREVVDSEAEDDRHSSDDSVYEYDMDYSENTKAESNYSLWFQATKVEPLSDSEFAEPNEMRIKREAYDDTLQLLTCQSTPYQDFSKCSPVSPLSLRNDISCDEMLELVQGVIAPELQRYQCATAFDHEVTIKTEEPTASCAFSGMQHGEDFIDLQSTIEMEGGDRLGSLFNGFQAAAGLAHFDL